MLRPIPATSPASTGLSITGDLVIKKTGQGYEVTSEVGKHLSKPNLTLEEAKKRLAQIEWFKHNKDHLDPLPTFPVS